MTGDDGETKWMTAEEANAYRAMQPRNRKERRTAKAKARKAERDRQRRTLSALRARGISGLVTRVGERLFCHETHRYIDEPRNA